MLKAALCFAAILTAQKPAKQEEIKNYGITVATDGKGLPPGQGNAVEGKLIFAARCAKCHGDKGQGEVGPALVGGHGTLATAKPLKTVGSFWPYATTVWDYVHRAMPFDQAGSLKNDEVYAAVAFILFRNGIIKESETMDAKSLPKVKMPNRDGFIQDPRPDVK